ncbi:MAG TPA: isoprenylcysteine carboxylmethyltransferase family protein [Stellaceae bacterium]|nr:isoprenylcysteine carboxylmethyltransferase family protein [Stellaceae bacterium]
MHPFYLAPIPAMWLGWLAYWIVASFGTKATRRRETLRSRLSYLAPLLLGVYLLSTPRAVPDWLSAPMLPRSPPQYLLGVGLVAAGIAFAIWARWHLAGYWSANVTLKEGHQLIRTGPYSWVRHPIYTGLLLAIAGTAVAQDEWRGLLALMLVTVSFWRKLRIEESWLSDALPEQYARYRAEVPALIPGLL